MKPSDNQDFDMNPAKARALCRAAGGNPHDWRNFLPAAPAVSFSTVAAAIDENQRLAATPSVQLNAVPPPSPAGRPVAAGDFDVVAGPSAPKLEIINGLGPAVCRLLDNARVATDDANARVLAQLRGVAAQPATATSDADPGNPNVREPCVEAPRPPALPEHPAIEHVQQVRLASETDKLRRAAAQALRSTGVTAEAIELGVRRFRKLSGHYALNLCDGSISGIADLSVLIDAVLAEILA